MLLTAALAMVAVLLALAAAGVVLAHGPRAHAPVYGLSLVASAVGLALALAALIGGGEPERLVLPLGLPWIGAHFRLDALAAFFLAVINLGGASASLYALGYGRHEPEPGRVLPYFPAFLAGMNLVLLADDAFTFLLSWELMSVMSWVLVMAHHREAGNARAGYVYLVMASFGTLALLLAFGLLAGPDGGYGFDVMRHTVAAPGLAALVLALALLGAGSKAGLVPL
ncbi:MAG: proton-conducting transporter membrane subunit, partial [Candidatus Eiseniibacteriota bacterium]